MNDFNILLTSVRREPYKTCILYAWKARRAGGVIGANRASGATEPTLNRDPKSVSEGASTASANYTK